MAATALTPKSNTSAVRLPATGSTTNVTTTAVPFGIYLSSVDFLSGAVDQVSYTYRKLGGDVLDVELTEKNVYTAYEEAVLEYSYIVNIHQAKNVLSDLLGNTTGTFDQDGNLKASSLSSSLSGTNIALKFPKVRFEYARRLSHGVATMAGIGGLDTEYSASFDTVKDKQDYDLQTIISSSGDFQRTNTLVGNNKITIKQVYYKTPQSMWRFYGYYGGLNTVGNLQNYGQWADDSQFQIVPVWQNKLQAKSFESSIYTRNSHYSYEIKNNNLRIFPLSTTVSPDKMWIKFTIKEDAWEDYDDRQSGVDGVNNMNTLPFANIPYENINSIGKQWIRRFALSLAKEMLGQIRGKFSTMPIPGDSVTLNHASLLSEAKEEKEKLREELKTTLDELTYAKLAEQDAAKSESILTVNKRTALPIFVG
jgi:hypothetical protein